MSSVGITENVKGDSKKFEVWYNGREEVYIIQVRDLRPASRHIFDASLISCKFHAGDVSSPGDAQHFRD